MYGQSKTSYIDEQRESIDEEAEATCISLRSNVLFFGNNEERDAMFSSQIAIGVAVLLYCLVATNFGNKYSVLPLNIVGCGLWFPGRSRDRCRSFAKWHCRETDKQAP